MVVVFGVVLEGLEVVVVVVVVGVVVVETLVLVGILLSLEPVSSPKKVATSRNLCESNDRLPTDARQPNTNITNIANTNSPSLAISLSRNLPHSDSKRNKPNGRRPTY